MPSNAQEAETQTRDRPATAFVLAAGLGKRMRPLTEKLPKPLIPLAGKPLIDHVLDGLAAAGITRAVVNVHYLATAIEQHLQSRTTPAITISDERAALLETGGGIVKALSQLGSAPFVIHNSDTVWIDRGPSNIARLLEAWRAGDMDCLMLLAPTERSLGYNGSGDFEQDTNGRLARRKPQTTAPFVYAGVSIMQPELFVGEPEAPFSLNRIWDRSIAAGRLYGIVLDGLWMHVGTPDALTEAEAAIAANARRKPSP